jgi:hypothetical protein
LSHLEKHVALFLPILLMFGRTFVLFVHTYHVCITCTWAFILTPFIIRYQSRDDIYPVMFLATVKISLKEVGGKLVQLNNLVSWKYTSWSNFGQGYNFVNFPHNLLLGRCLDLLFFLVIGDDVHYVVMSGNNIFNWPICDNHPN